MNIRIGSRGSALALAQTNDVAARLRGLGHGVEVMVIETAGDKNKEARFADIGAPGVFVREIESALLDNRVDAAVHSYKDLPSASPEGLVVAAIAERLDAADHLIAHRDAVVDVGTSVVPLTAGAVVGTASERRRALLCALRPDLQMEAIRGNVPTRIDKLREGPFQAIVLAGAGLQRLRRDPAAPPLGLEELVDIRLDPAIFVPSPSQGAIALQCRADAPVRDALAALNDADAVAPVSAERELQRLVDGGCNLPFGAWASIDGEGSLQLMAVLDVGGELVRVQERGGSPQEIAARAWQRLQAAREAKSRGGGEASDE
jgi:hydroxymethylbilane synthase